LMELSNQLQVKSEDFLKVNSKNLKLKTDSETLLEFIETSTKEKEKLIFECNKTAGDVGKLNEIMFRTLA